MAWKIEYPADLKKQLKNIRKDDQLKLKKTIEDLAKVDDPSNSGKRLKGNLKELNSIRVGNYRIIYKAKNEQLIILILRIGHRKNIYRDKS